MRTLTRWDIQGGDDAGIFPEECVNGEWCCATEAHAAIAELEAELAAIKAQGVVMYGSQLAGLLEQVRLDDDEAKPHGSGATYWNNAVVACQVAIRDALAATVQQVVPDGSTKMQWQEIVALVNEVLGCEAHKYPCERGSIGHEMTGINFNSLARIIDRVRYAAAPIKIEANRHDQ